MRKRIRVNVEQIKTNINCKELLDMCFTFPLHTREREWERKGHIRRTYMIFLIKPTIVRHDYELEINVIHPINVCTYPTRRTSTRTKHKITSSFVQIENAFISISTIENDAPIFIFKRLIISINCEIVEFYPSNFSLQHKTGENALIVHLIISINESMQSHV